MKKSQLRVGAATCRSRSATALSFARCLIADHDWVDKMDGKGLHLSSEDAMIIGRWCFRCGKEERGTQPEGKIMKRSHVFSRPGDCWLPLLRKEAL